MLIRCPDCGGAVSENADKCPKCGNKITQEVITHYKEEMGRSKNLAVGIIKIGLVLITIVFIVFLFSIKFL